MNIKGIDWDDGNTRHCQEHGVSIDEIEHVLQTMAFRIPDPYPNEPRYRTAAETEQGRHVFLVFMYREKEDGLYLRPISARYMHKKEIEKYEEIKKQLA